jgi:hypothetical protein
LLVATALTLIFLPVLYVTWFTPRAAGMPQEKVKVEALN